MSEDKGAEPPYDTAPLLRLEALAKALFANSKGDSADAVMGLLVAAVHLSMNDKGLSGQKLLGQLAYMLGCATVCADDFFGQTTKH